MAIPRGHRFDIVFDSAFPQGLVLVGDVTPDNEYQTREDKAAGRCVRSWIKLRVSGSGKPRSLTLMNRTPSALHLKSRSSPTSNRFRRLPKRCLGCARSSLTG